MRCRALWAIGLALAVSGTSAQLKDLDPDWKESDLPEPPAFDVTRVIDLDMPRHMTVKLGVDPETIRVTSDGLVRYVMVARSPGGTVNATYEGIRCLTAEVKVYARYTANKTWVPVPDPNWMSLRHLQGSTHALAFARQGACEGRSAVTSTPQAIVKKLKGNEINFQHK